MFPSLRNRLAAAFLTIALFAGISVKAQGQVVLSAAVNGASYINSALPNGKLAQGVLFIAFGQGMGPASIQRASTFPLPTNLVGTTIRVTVGGITVNCIVLYTLATQVAAILPSNTPVGTGTMVLSFNGANSAPLSITVVARSFGIFAINQGGSGPGVFTDPFTNVANGITTAANPANLLDIWGTGLGAVGGDEAAGPLPGDITSANVQVFAGGVQAQILYRGRSGCCAGVDQIRIAVPAGLSGCYITLYVVVDGVVSNTVTISVAPSGSTCTDPGGYSPDLLSIAQANGGLRIGAVGLSRMHQYGRNGTDQGQGDSIFAGFSRITLANLTGGGTTPAAGNCVVNQFPGPSVPLPEGLDAGPQLTVVTPMGTYPMAPPFGGGPTSVGNYFTVFLPGGTGGISIPGVVGDGTVLQPGHYTASGPGGSRVGAFTTSVDLPAKLDWTNRTAITTINRNQPLTITWANGYTGSGALLVVNGQSSSALGVGAAFSCWTSPATGTFTVPAAILSAMPPSYTDSNGTPQGSLNVFQQLYFGPPFTASGIDVGSTQWADGFNTSGKAYQ